MKQWIRTNKRQYTTCKETPTWKKRMMFQMSPRMMEECPSATSAASILTSFTWATHTPLSDSDWRQHQYINTYIWRTHVSLLQKRQNLGNVVESEDTVGGLLEAVELEYKRRALLAKYMNSHVKEKEIVDSRSGSAECPSEGLTSLQPESSSSRAMRTCPSWTSWNRSWTSIGGSHWEGWRRERQLEERHRMNSIWLFWFLIWFIYFEQEGKWEDKRDTKPKHMKEKCKKN